MTVIPLRQPRDPLDIYVSPRLAELAEQAKTSTEADARAKRNQPRIPKARGLADLIAEQANVSPAFRSLFAKWSV